MLDVLSSEVIQIVAKRPCLNGFVFIARLPNNKITPWVVWFSTDPTGILNKQNIRFKELESLAWSIYQS